MEDYPMYLSVSLSNYAIKGIDYITITVGSSGHICSTLSCNINTLCSSSPVLCLTGSPIDSNCYSSMVGGTIYVNIVKPTQTSNIETCSLSTTPLELFTAELTLSSVSKYSPTPIPTPLALLPSKSLVGIKGAPFYAIAFSVVLFIIYGVIIIRLRDANDSVTDLKLSKVCFQLGLFGFNIASEFAYIGAVLGYNDGNLKAFGSIILVARLCHIPVGCYVLVKLMTGGRDVPNHYLQLTDKDDLLRNRTAYSLLFLTSFLDNTNIAFLPWLGSKV